jgi:YVTN family beta-propeller protein
VAGPPSGSLYPHGTMTETRRRALRLTSRIRLLAIVVALGLTACSSGTMSFFPETSSRSSEARKAVSTNSSRRQNPRVARDIYRWIETSRLAPSVRRFPERVYVPNSQSATVDVIDPRTYRIVRHFRVGNIPHHITPSWDMSRLYVDNTGGDSLTVIDPARGRPLRRVHVRDPYNLYFTPDGSKAIVVAERYNALDFRDRRTWRLLKSVPIPAAGPDHLDFSANGRFLLISTEFSGRVYRVNTDKMRVTGRALVGGLPVDVKLSPDGSVFYVANQGLNGVTVVDAGDLHKVRFIPTGAGAHGLCISRDGHRLYVSNRVAGTISVVDMRHHQRIGTWHVGGSPDMMQVSPDGRRLWFTNRFNGTVGIADTRTGRLVRTIRVGDAPHGLTYFPQPGRFSIGHNGVYR